MTGGEDAHPKRKSRCSQSFVWSEETEQSDRSKLNGAAGQAESHLPECWNEKSQKSRGIQGPEDQDKGIQKWQVADVILIPSFVSKSEQQFLRAQMCREML